MERKEKSGMRKERKREGWEFQDSKKGKEERGWKR